MKDFTNVEPILREYVGCKFDLVSIDILPKCGEIIYGEVLRTIYKYMDYIYIVVLDPAFCAYKRFLVVPHGNDILQYRKEFYKHIHTGKYIEVFTMTDDGWRNMNSFRTDKYRITNSYLIEDWSRRIKRCKYLSKAGSKINVNLLLHGEPGTGKTQFATDLASSLAMNLYIMNLSKTQCFTNRTTSNSIYLIEEIDKVLMPDGSFIAEMGDAVTILLQFLDGILRPKKSVVLITCNDLARVKANKVLSRPGRVTRYIEFGTVTETQCMTLSETRYPGEDYRRLWSIVEPLKPTIAELSLYVNDSIIDEVSFSDMLDGVKVGLSKTKSSNKKTESSLYY